MSGSGYLVGLTAEEIHEEGYEDGCWCIF